MTGRHRVSHDGRTNLESSGHPLLQRPDLADGYAANNPGMKRPRITGWTGNGVHSTARPQLADAHARGRGVHANDQAGTCAERQAWLREWMNTLSDRLRNVRVCCGDWKRVCSSPSVTTRLGTTAVFLDPPYRVTVKGKESRSGGLYATDKGSDLDKLQKNVLSYCLKRGTESKMRIAVCALEGEGYEPLVEAGWTEVHWSSKGYGMRTEKGKTNAARERIFFSPNCLDPARDLHPLFADLAE